jgi:hypothetical protein
VRSYMACEDYYGDQNMRNQKLLRYYKVLSQYFPGRIDERLKILKAIAEPSFEHNINEAQCNQHTGDCIIVDQHSSFCSYAAFSSVQSPWL